MSRIISLQSSNYKRLRAVAIEPDPDGNLVIIAGKNGQGKSSILDSITAALGGVDNRSTPEPIRRGEKKAQIILKTEEIVVERTFTASGSTLKVMTPNGATFPKGQARLDDLLGKLSLDPLAFTQQDAKKQVATLLDLVDLPFDPQKLAEERKRQFDFRAGQNRAVKDLEARVSQYDPELFDGVPDEEINLRDAMAEYKEAERLMAEAARRSQAIDTLEEEAGKLKEKLASCIASAATIAAQHDDLADQVPTNEQLAQLAEKVDGVQETNALVRDKQVFTSLSKDLESAQADVDGYNHRMDEIDREKAEGLAAAEFPIEGLGFDDSGVTYQGVPFKQASSAEQLRVSLAMAMAMNPTLRVIRIADGSLLDSDNLALIESMAKEHDFQVWLEMVGDSGERGILIEDGQVV